MHVQEPYKLANRAFHPEDSIIDVSGVKIGREPPGPYSRPLLRGIFCSGNGHSQIRKGLRCQPAARRCISSPVQAHILSRDSVMEGLDILCEVKEEAGLPIVTELMSPEYLEIFNEKVDLIQIGARNMQNFDLLKQLGQLDRPILLKRGLNATYEEWIMSAEYIMASGNENVILCERGIRTFETLHKKYARSSEHTCSEEKNTSACHRRPEPCRRKMVAGRANGKSVCCCRC